MSAVVSPPSWVVVRVVKLVVFMDATCAVPNPATWDTVNESNCTVDKDDSWVVVKPTV